MKRVTIGLIAGAAITVGVVYLIWGRSARAGPYGGDLVPLKDGTAYAEVLTNADTGEVMVHTWDRDLKTSRPVQNEPLVLGSGEHRVQLMPHPTDRDPSGSCSRFYGQADWVRGGSVRHGWLHQRGHEEHRSEFDWQRCWQAGRAQEPMWAEMGEHRHMEPEHGPDHQGGRMER